MTTDVRAIIAGVLAHPTAIADDVLAALAAHGVILVTDVPPVTEDGGILYAGGNRMVAVPMAPEPAWKMARQWAAVARHLDTVAEPDPADVETLGRLVAESSFFAQGTPAQVARDLLRAGVRPPRADA